MKAIIYSQLLNSRLSLMLTKVYWFEIKIMLKYAFISARQNYQRNDPKIPDILFIDISLFQL